MSNNIYFCFMHTNICFILSLVLLWFNTKAATNVDHQLVAASGGAVHMCIDKERQALLDFKAQISLDPDGKLSTWRPEEEDDCCQWRGVGCSNQTGHVTSLDLRQRNYRGSRLEGKITVSLLNLSYLNHLDLSSNSFHGTIPEFIYSMTHLRFLDLSSNSFHGTIPMSIGNMTQLTELDLSFNQFTGCIPMSIGSLTKLTKLDLRWNQFTGTIPSTIGSLTELTELILEGNNLSGTIPQSIGSLTKLTDLYLSENSFYGTIPTEFGNLAKLEYLSLRSNLTVENLDWVSSLSSLKVLSMDGISLAKINNWVNVIIGLRNLYDLSLVGCDLSQVMHPYSPSINASSSVEILYLGNNNLNSSMFNWLCPLFGNRLGALYLSGNKFDGKLSDFLNNLSGCTSAATLHELYASSNQLIGSLSDDIQKFSSLKRLDLSSNQLDGTITDKLWQLPSLQRLYLSSNSLRGVVYKNIGKPNLRYIDFSSNKLGPRFPKWIQKLKNLTHLDLSNNSISDTVSSEYWNQWKSSNLAHLNLSFNNVTGKLPKSLSNHNLNIVDLSVNCFYGPIPAFPSHINFLDLSRNKFNGGMSSFCQIYKNLEFLDLSHNTITGQLPDCFRNLTHLVVLNLRDNSLSGSIPPSVGCLGQLETLSLYNNNLSGALPLSLKNCTQLSFLDLGVNSLYGNIPVWIGENLSRLYALSLKSNSFFGTIPSQICQLVSLQFIDLSFNNLNGKIPSCVNNLTSMVKKGSYLNPNVHHYNSSGEMTVYIGSTELSDTVSVDVDNSYTDHMMIQWQGKINEFSKNLGYVKSIDFSANRLTGQIPYEITDLHGSVVLNLSHNTLVGAIPKYIGQMKELQTLDLSKNNLSGGLPSSMSQLNFLNFFDVSHNNLSGRIPSGTQLQTFEPVRYIGNAGLCGSPLPKKCPGDDELAEEPRSIGKSEGEEDGIDIWFVTGLASGFAIGFLTVCNALLLNRRGRHAFFQLHDSLKDWVYVKVVVFIAKLQRVALA